MKYIVSFVSPYFFRNYQWYRKYIGGRWEKWHIGICHADMWLAIHVDAPDDRYQPCSIGPQLAREDYT